MKDVEEDQAREDRISMEIIVDSYGSEEQALGWYTYLYSRLDFPFRAQCVQERDVSPLRHGEEVVVMRMAPEDDCMSDMTVIIRWCEREMGVPLAQLEAVGADYQTKEAIGDWHYWIARGYRLV
jgi:hypothetical protein